MLDQELQKTNDFICGNHMTVVDIVLYCEISTILALTLKKDDDLATNNPHINKWYLRMKAVNGMADLDKELAEIVSKYDLTDK